MAAAVLLLGCTTSSNSTPSPHGSDGDGLPLGAVSYQQVVSHPEAQLSYPDAQLYKRFGGPEQKTMDGTNIAFAGAIFTSPDPPPKIYDWYRQWMRSHGWHDESYPLASTQSSLQGYARGRRERFYVAMDRPDALGMVLGAGAPSNATIFEIRYAVIPYKDLVSPRPLSS